MASDETDPGAAEKAADETALDETKKSQESVRVVVEVGNPTPAQPPVGAGSNTAPTVQIKSETAALEGAAMRTTPAKFIIGLKNAAQRSAVWIAFASMAAIAASVMVLPRPSADVITAVVAPAA